MLKYVIHIPINVSKWNKIITFLGSKIKIACKWANKGDFENPEFININMIHSFKENMLQPNDFLPKYLISTLDCKVGSNEKIGFWTKFQ